MTREGSKHVRSRNGGFTLVEVLVVVAIVALLLAILLPSLSRARQVTRGAVCLSNLRQFSLAAHAYAHGHQGRYPIAYYSVFQPTSVFISYAWDFTTIKDWSAGLTVVKAGLLWQGGKTIEQVHQCPCYQGSDNWADIAHTGYNYNTSYIGTCYRSSDPAKCVAPVKAVDVRRPAVCALFGDGEYVGGANKFMRSPWKYPARQGYRGHPARDVDEFPDGKARYAGTQGYRHLGKTNVAFCDGHARSWLERHTETYDSARTHIAPGTGFLSPDNSLYDLE